MRDYGVQEHLIKVHLHHFAQERDTMKDIHLFGRWNYYQDQGQSRLLYTLNNTSAEIGVAVDGLFGAVHERP